MTFFLLQDILKLLLEKDGDPNCREANGDPLLIVAAKLGNYEAFIDLIEHSAYAESQESRLPSTVVTYSTRTI